MPPPMPLMDESSDSDGELKINKSYADAYDNWRKGEEMQKLKDLSKNISDSSSESEEEENPTIEEDFLKTLSLLKSRDPKIYDEETHFFTNDKAPAVQKTKKEKPMFMKDYERKLLLERNGQFSSDDEEHIPTKGPTLLEEQAETKKEFKEAFGDSESEEEDLLQVKVKSKKEQEDEEADYLKWIKGKKQEISEDTKKDMSYLRKFWSDPKLDEGEKYLRDYILNQKYLENDQSDEVPTYEDITTLSDDEKLTEQQEEFEHKFNFRFEEPDQDFIKRYPRTIGDSMRRVDSKRKEKRDEYAERKKKEKDLKREELKRLKALKRKEIEEMFTKLKEVSGAEELNLRESDMESDFDPDKHDQKMGELFNDDYYAVEEEQKPEFEYDEELDNVNWDQWTRKEVENTSIEACVSDQEQGSDENGEKDLSSIHQNSFGEERTQSKKKKKKKKSLFAKVMSQSKPIFDSQGKSYEEYLNEYYKMDFEDVIGDMPVRFKYRKVVPNDFGLTVDEVLNAHDRELNQWCSVKKMCQYRRDDEEMYDVKAFQRKADNMTMKQRVLSSVYALPKEKEVDEIDGDTSKVETKKKRKKKKKKNKSGSAPSDNTTDNVQSKSTVATSSNQTNINIKQNDFNENKRKNKKVLGDPKEDSFNNNSTFKNKSLKAFPGSNSNVTTATLDSVSKSTKTKQLNESDSIENNNEQWGLNEIKTKHKKEKRKRQFQSESLYEENLTEHVEGISDEATKPHKKRREELSVPSDVNRASEVDHDSEINLPLDSTNCVSNPKEATSSKKKRKKKKKSKNNQTPQFGHKLHHLNEQSEINKKLTLTDERLAAYGINPKKFKRSIKYGHTSY